MRDFYNCPYFPEILPIKRQPYKMVKRTQTIRRQFADELFECVCVFDHFVGLELKGLTSVLKYWLIDMIVWS